MLLRQSREVEYVENRLALAMGSRPRDHAACIDALEAAIHLARTDSAAAEWFIAAELFGELADEYEAVGRVDDALEAMRRAIDAGWHGAPDGRCRLAEILMRAGRRAEADSIWLEVKADTPEDIWLYNNAGLEYADLGDHVTALVWLDEAMRIALRTGDPKRLTDQLLRLRAGSLAALGRQPDDLQAMGEAFLDSPPPAGMASDAGTRPAPVPANLCWPWFTAEAYDAALRRWPALVEPAADHLRYCRSVQLRLLQAMDAGAVSVRIVPIHLAAYLDWCERSGADPAIAAGGYAETLTAQGSPDLIRWPPGRNDACWCGYGRKYKKCCGATQDD